MKDVVVIGAGLAGLNCARTLQTGGLDVLLIEASDAVGGRVRTDVVDGFLLDRGFQVLLTAYPESKKTLDYVGLDLKNLKPGALVWHGGRFHHFADPFRDPLAAVSLAFDPIVSFGDKLRVAKLRGRVTRGEIANLFTHEETTTRSFLQTFGFSPWIIERFFQPFFGGVFLEIDLTTSSRYFEFLFRMFSTGAVAVPATGMEAIPRQLADKLGSGTLLLDSPVTQITPRGKGFTVSFEFQSNISSRSVVIATPEPEARRLLQSIGISAILPKARTWNSTTAFYFAADHAPVHSPILMLNGEGKGAGPVNNAVVMSEVSRSYAPAGASLISASVIGKAPTGPEQTTVMEQEVREQLARWLGPKVKGWQSLGVRSVAQALPLQTTADWEQGNPQSGRSGLFLCGDFLETASIQGSLASGRRAAQALLAFLSR